MSTATLLLLGSFVWAAGEVRAAVPACDNFVSSATADGIRTSVFSPDYLTVESADVQSPFAQAYVDALGQSVAVAGAPYPGDTVISGLALGGVPTNTYPLAVSSQYPTNKESKQDAPAVKLVAQSEKARSRGDAKVSGSEADGVGRAGSTYATATAGCAEGLVESTSGTSVDGFSIADGLLEIEAVRSEASAVSKPGEEVGLDSRMQAIGVTVAGQEASITREGLVIADSPVLSVPGLPADNPVVHALAEEGIEVVYLDAITEPGKSITSAGIQVTVTREVTGTGPTQIEYTLGRASARVGSKKDSASYVPPPGPPPSGENPAGESPPGEGMQSSGSIGGPGGGTAGPPQSSGGPQAGTQPKSGGAEPLATDMPTEVEAVSFAPPDRSAMWGYLALMGVGLLIVICGNVVRMFGVRLRWT